MSESTVALVAVAITATANVILQIMARIEAARVSQQAKDDAADLKQAALDAATQAADVKKVLAVATTVADTKLDGLAVMTEKIHVLSNSGALAAAKLNAELSRWKADQTHDPAHVAAAEAAEKLYHEHEIKQQKVDSMPSKPEGVTP